MGYRKVRCKRNSAMLAKLEEFVNKVRGKDYNLDLALLMKKDCEEDETENIPE